MTIVLFFTLILLLCFDLYINKNILAPFCLLALSFLQRCLGLLFVENDLEVNLHIETYFFILSTLILFFLGGLIGRYLYKIQYNELVGHKIFYINKKICWIYMFVGAGALYLCYQYVSNFALLVLGGTNIGVADVMGNARSMSMTVMSQTTERLIPTWLLALIHINDGLSYICIYGAMYNIVINKNHKESWMYFIPSVFSSCYYFLMGSRALIISFITYGVIIYCYMFIFVHGLKKMQQKLIKIIMIMLPVLLILASAGGIMRSEKDYSFYKDMFIRDGSCIAALDYYLQDKVDLNSNPALIGANTFIGVYGAMESIGVNVPHLYLPARPMWFSNGSMTNLYTGLMRYHLDYGIIGTLVIMFILGFVFGIAYKYSIYKRKTGFFFIVYIYYLKNLFSMGAEERFLTTISLSLIFNMIFMFLFYKMFFREE